MTDYPDQELILNLRHNIAHSAAPTNLHNISAEGYLWGNSPSNLTAHLSEISAGAPTGAVIDKEGFDLLILADLLFNHSEHRKLVISVQKTLKRTAEAKALVFFTPHRPWLFERDMAFFDLAREMGFVVEKVMEKTLEKAMVENGPVRRSIHDTGDEEVRKVEYIFAI